MASRFSTKDISSIKERVIFFDTNILVYIFWPTGNNNWQNFYSKTFSNLLKQKNQMVIDYITISELINLELKIEHEKYIQNVKYLNYKNFRNSKEGVEVISDIFTILKDDILKVFEVITKPFNKSDIVDFLTIDNLDFNDKAIVNICKENNYVLLTNDLDFKDSDIDILTSNSNILN